MWVAHPPPRALPYNRRQQNIHPRDRPDGRRCSCDVEVLGVAVPPGSEDFHHERRREAAAPGAVGHAVGRRRRRRAVPGREDRQGLPPRHVPLPPRGRRPGRRGRFLQRLRPRRVPALRLAGDRGQRARRQRRAPVASSTAASCPSPTGRSSSSRSSPTAAWRARPGRAAGRPPRRRTGSPSCSRCWRGCRRAPSWPAGWRSTR